MGLVHRDHSDYTVTQTRSTLMSVLAKVRAPHYAPIDITISFTKTRPDYLSIVWATSYAL